MSLLLAVAAVLAVVNRVRCHSSPSSSDISKALPPEAVVSTDKVRSQAKRYR
jgi:hypothetical protein